MCVHPIFSVSEAKDCWNSCGGQAEFEIGEETARQVGNTTRKRMSSGGSSETRLDRHSWPFLRNGG